MKIANIYIDLISFTFTIIIKKKKKKKKKKLQWTDFLSTG